MHEKSPFLGFDPYVNKKNNQAGSDFTSSIKNSNSQLSNNAKVIKIGWAKKISMIFSKSMF